MKKNKEFFYAGYYEILDVPEDSTIEEIKSAFRKLAQMHHPDKNNNTAESHATFILISHAYNVLVDPVKKKEYDTYLRTSNVLRNWKKTTRNFIKTLPGKKGDIYRSNKALLNHFNFLLWEIEDFIRKMNSKYMNGKNKKISPQHYILKILAFIDKWVLGPAGYPDYFMEARKMRSIDPMDYIKNIGFQKNKSGYRPFVSITGYFYDIRKRMDRFLKKTTIQQLLVTIPNHNIRLIDCIVEAQNYTIHYLSYLLQIQTGSIEPIPPFTHSYSCF